MKIIFMGTPDFAAASLEALIDSRHEIQAVVTQPDKPKGRKGELTPSPVKVVAEEKGIKVYQPLKVRDEEFVKTLRAYNPDVIVVVAFGQIIPLSILQMPKFGCVNIHGSLLPKYRGLLLYSGLYLTERRKPELLPYLWMRALIQAISCLKRQFR